MSSEWTPKKQKEYKDDKRGYCLAPPRSTPALDDAFNRYFLSRHLSGQLARHNYWYPSIHAGDEFARAVIPGTSQLKYNKFWQARYMGKDPQVKRYQSPPFDRGDSVVITYPMRLQVSRGDRVVVVEGPFDALAASEEGFTGVALMGVTPADAVLTHVRDRFMDNELLLVADKDAAEPMVKVMNNLVRVGFRGKLRVLTTAPYKDLAETPISARMKLLE